MAVEGPLSELGLQDVFQLLELSRKTGVLTLSSERRAHRAFVHFDRGAVIAAFKEGQDVRPLLGHLLLRAGKVTEAELRRAREIQLRHPERRIGEVLVEMGSLSPEALQEELRFQIEETVYELMGWDEGYFSFRETDEVLEPPPLVRVRTESLLMEGARRVDEWTVLEEKVPGPHAVPALLSPGSRRDPGVLDLLPEEWEVLGEVDGRRSVREIAVALGRSEFEVAKTVFGLVNTGVVEILEAPRPREVPRGLRDRALDEVRALADRGELDRARVAARRLEHEFPEDPEVFRLSGRVLMAQGRHRAALEAYRRAVELDPLSPDAHRALGFAAVLSGELDDAVEAWGTYLRLAGPGDGEAARVERALAALRALKAECDREREGGRP